MKFYIMRHGETDWNSLGKIQGRIDNPLNADGQNQAKNKAAFFADINPDLLVSSRLDRAKETLQIIKETHSWQAEHQIDDLFIERDFGELEGSIADDYYDITDFSQYKLFEKHHDLSDRAISGLEKYQNDYENVVIASHSHTIRSILIGLFPEKYSWDEFKRTKLPNLAVIEIEYDQDTKEYTLHGIH